MMSKTRFITLIIVAIVLLLPALLWAGTIQLPQTGQTQCYDTTGDGIDCGGTGQDGDMRAGVAWPDSRFVDNGNGTITDRLTGLMWLKDSGCLGVNTSWQTALDAVAGFNTNPSEYGCQDYDENNPPYSDWHLPNVLELESLMNAGEPDVPSWLSMQGFHNVQPIYWTSTTSAQIQTNEAWIIYLSFYIWPNGKVIGDTVVPFGVWAVRYAQNGIILLPKTGQTTCYSPLGDVIDCAGTGQDGEIQAGVEWPNPRFTDNQDGTIKDNLTGLVWTRDASMPTVGNCSAGTYSWQDALSYIACLNENNYLGHSDWRMPNRRELRSLITYSVHDRYTPPLPSGHPFQNVQLSYYWESTTNAYERVTAWTTIMQELGVEGRDWKANPYNYVHLTWPVRGGQVGPQPPRFPLDIVYRDHIKYRMCDPLYPGDGEHKGIDIMAPVNTSIYPVCDGIVVLNNTHTENIKKYKTPYDRYFNSFLIIKHNCSGQILYGYYGHLKSNLNKDSEVKVKDNTPIGFIREAYSWPDIRNPNQDHLHLGINIEKYESKNWGIAPSGISCANLEKMGWRDLIDYFGW